MPSLLTRRAALALGGVALVTPPWARAQIVTGSFVVAGLTPVPRTAAHWVALFDELRRNGFLEGINLSVRGYGIAPDRLEPAAAEFVKAGVHAIVTGGAGPTRVAQRATPTIPILTAVDEFVEQGFVTSLSRPGGNITGVSILGPALDAKRLEILIEIAPHVRSIAILADPNSTSADSQRALEETVGPRGIRITTYRAGQQSEIGPAIDAAGQAGAQAFNVLASQFFNVNRAEIMARIGRLRVPAIYQWPEWTLEGALAAYGPRFTTVYRQVARQLAKVLRGARPAEIPIEQPTNFELVVNLKQAKAIGLTIPAEILFRADSVIE